MKVIHFVTACASTCPCAWLDNPTKSEIEGQEVRKVVPPLYPAIDLV